ncbi:MAG TPA: 23S rRNA (guanosine(2251)-2'-O)-methyltransferase RlmB [Candidatus Scatavimonas merdigallinarum]|uniref:23S rRNA (Guanosine(2251)-2'-O)-methyltransferase RlmB n=1 Tax=Candidatus Scatavimonas merdigallinarum TaxID=2840914 RepID=A0A9D1CUY0_9FIRM|nr:23S rRNA (guanosine(2251)-2'-O)-methyltransferase RlmB [Candidatus Scatavimonas merdigallinarum]
MERKKTADCMIGRNCVREAIKSGRTLDRVFVAKGLKDGSLRELVIKARGQGAVIKEADTKKLDQMAGGAPHQGIIAFGAVKAYAQLEDVFLAAQKKNEAPFIMVLDEIEDPHNLGAIIRTAECAGVHGVIIPKRRSVGLSGTVGKASAGAAEYMPVVRVANISSAIAALKKKGVWVYGADMNGQTWCQCDLAVACALVIGNEGRGLGRLVRESCDGVLSLPLCGKIASLNASVAAGVLMYEVVRQRKGL